MSAIAFVGGGNMSWCIFEGILRTRDGTDSFAVSGPHPDKLKKFAEKGAKITSSNFEAASFGSIIFLGVKPQNLTAVLKELKSQGIDFKEKLLISMAAGFRFASIAKITGSRRIIRIMPNTPAKLGLGVVGICCDEVSCEDKKLAFNLTEGLGTLIDLKDEEGINVIGAVAGSAPAFMYRFIDALIKEAQALGLDDQQARKVVEQMALGTVSMVIANQDQKVSALKDAVVSKGGTTFEGLRIMTEYGFEDLIKDTIAATIARSHELERMF